MRPNRHFVRTACGDGRFFYIKERRICIRREISNVSIFETKTVDVQRKFEFPSPDHDLVEEEFRSIAGGAKPRYGAQPTVALAYVISDPRLFKSKSDGFSRS